MQDVCEAALVDRAREGDEAAFEELVRRFERRIYALAYRMSGNHHDAEDLSQQVFLRVHQGLTSFSGNSRFYTWLYRIAVNVCMNHLRKGKRRAMLLREWTEENKQIAARCHDCPEQVVATEDVRNHVMAAVDALPPKQRTAFTLKFLEGHKYREVAELMHCSVGTVKAHCHQAMQALKARVGMSPVMTGKGDAL